MKNLIVDKKNSGKKISNFLQTQFNNLSYGTICKALRNKDIRVNDIKINENIILNEGDKVTIYIKDELLEKPASFSITPATIIYEDNNILVVNKPKGITVESDSGEKGLDAYLAMYYNNPNIKACHRLDRNTSGLVIFSKNDLIREKMFELIKERKVRKFYRCTVYGCPKQNSATLKAFLFKDSKNSKVIISDVKKKGYQEIVTRYTLLNKNKDGTSTLEVELITGRTHQIRAHLAHIGLPIIGDGKYGINSVNKQFGKKYQELEAYKLIFDEAYDELSYLKGASIKL